MMESVNDISEIDHYTPKSMQEVLASMHVQLLPEASKQNDPLFHFITHLNKDTFSAMCNLMKTYGVLLPKHKQKNKVDGQDSSKRSRMDGPNVNGASKLVRLVLSCSHSNAHR